MNDSIKHMMQEIGQRARQASRAMASASSEQKDQALLRIAQLVRQQAQDAEEHHHRI